MYGFLGAASPTLAPAFSKAGGTFRRTGAGAGDDGNDSCDGEDGTGDVGAGVLE